MIEIVPTILTDNISNFNQFFGIYQTFSNRIQIDITDGKFARFPTIDLESLVLSPDWNGNLDLHMMVAAPSTYLPTILKIHPSLCIFHAECNENLLPIFEQLSAAGIKTGVALLKSTYPGNIKPYIEAVDHVLIFAGSLGQQGGEADMLQLEKTSIIKNIDAQVEIGWDGGANLQNIRSIAHSDINVVNVGSALSRSPNPAEMYKALSAETDKQGVNI